MISIWFQNKERTEVTFPETFQKSRHTGCQNLMHVGFSSEYRQPSGNKHQDESICKISNVDGPDKPAYPHSDTASIRSVSQP